jgi:hypothetical protein
LLRLVSGLDTLADGYFRAYHGSDTIPWLVVRTIDDDVFEIESRHPLVSRIRQARRRESPDAPEVPSSQTVPQLPTSSGGANAPRAGWDPLAYADEMRRGDAPVSAFFHIDTSEAISKCRQWLSLLAAYDAPDIGRSRYFDDVRSIFESRKEVTNFDHEFSLSWEGARLPSLLRCHSVAPGTYEVELWLPGVIANELADKFGDGREAFFCAFMPPLFYD